MRPARLAFLRDGSEQLKNIWHTRNAKDQVSKSDAGAFGGTLNTEQNHFNCNVWDIYAMGDFFHPLRLHLTDYAYGERHAKEYHKKPAKNPTA